jgi:hypothetical protein
MPGVSRTATTPIRISSNLQQIRRIALQRPDAFIQSQLKVIDKTAGVLPFKYNWEQQQVAKKITEIEEAHRPVRLYILKSRQVGMSTFVAARLFTKVWALDNAEGIVMAHLEIRARELISRCKGFYSSLKPSLKLKLSQDSKAALQFADTRGILNIITAKNFEASVGGTKQYLQMSEFSRYGKAVKILIALEQPIAYKEGTEIYLETTGHGHGSQAHEFWMACKTGRENYDTIFLAWQDNPACTYQFLNDKDRDMKCGMAYEYEPRLRERQKLFNLSAGNIYYAYLVLKNQCHGDYEEFLENYPCDDEEAWRATGQSYFGAENLNAIKTADYQYQYFVFPTANIDDTFARWDELQIVEKLDENGNRPFIKLWSTPKPMGNYVVSGDSAEGVEDGNYSSSFVIDMDTFEMMAEFHGRVRPDEHARIIASLCDIYNGAVAANEYNTPGNVTLAELKRIYFGNIYRWRYIDDHKFKLSNKLGWQTNTQSRPLMLQLAKRIVDDVARDKVLTRGVIKSRFLVDEMKTFVVDELDGTPAADIGCSDDRVMAWAIALIVAYQESQHTGRDFFSNIKAEETQKFPTFGFQDYNGGGLEPRDVIAKLEGEIKYGSQNRNEAGNIAY